MGPVGGFAVYDLRSGHTTFTKLSSPHGIAPRQLFWAGDSVVYAAYGHVDSRGGVATGNWAAVRGTAHPSLALMAELGDVDHVSAPAGYGRLLVNETTYDKHASPLHGQTKHVLINLVTGRRTTFIQRTTAGRGSAALALLGHETSPEGAVVSPSGALSAYADINAKLGVARLDRGVVAPLPSPLAVRIGSVVGWLDDGHVVITSPTDKAHPTSTLRIATIGGSGPTGSTTSVTGLPPVVSVPSQGIAYELLARPTFRAHKPPSPLGIRKELGVAAVVALLAGAGIALRRRRAGR